MHFAFAKMKVRISFGFAAVQPFRVGPYANQNKRDLGARIPFDFPTPTTSEKTVCICECEHFKYERYWYPEFEVNGKLSGKALFDIKQK